MQSRVLAILVAVVLALVATAALVVYVNGADRRAIADQEPVRVFVALKPIKAGTRGDDALNQGLIDRQDMARKNVTDETIRSVNQLADRFAAVDIVPGEQLLQIPTGHQALAIELDLTKQVAGFVTPGDSVSLVLSMKRGGQDPVERSEFLLQNIRVLAVGTTALANTSTQGAGRVNQGKGTQTLTAVTLAVKTGDVERVVYAAEYGSIYLSLLPPKAEEWPRGGGRTADDVIPTRQQ
jgi:pilus assembly protein CpaB